MVDATWVVDATDGGGIAAMIVMFYPRVNIKILLTLGSMSIVCKERHVEQLYINRIEIMTMSQL